ncbi:MAG: hypothetical protein PHV34_20080 [Verrucomicrobiae bacterium]|nr:hypothetical protein [Verrucomicrobiae bacterium]
MILDAFKGRIKVVLSESSCAVGQVERVFPSEGDLHQKKGITSEKRALTSANRVDNGTTTWAIANQFDAANRLTSQQQGSYSVGFSYNRNSEVKEIAYPSSLNVKYQHDALNAVSEIQQGTSTTVASYQRDEAGRLTKRTQANGVETLYQQNAAGYVTNMLVRSTSGATNILSNTSYGFDSVGNRLWTKRKNGRGEVYQYNANYEVIGVKYNVDNPTDGYAAATNPSRTVIYNLDSVGNRTSVTDNGTNTLYTINNLNQYTAVGSKNLSYDGKGNLTGDGTWTFSYDHDNNLVGASKTGTTATYQRDALGRRISKTVNGVTTTYIYAGDNLIEERNADGTVKAQYIYEAGIDRPVKAIIGGVDYYFSQDILGNVIALTDASGALVEQYWYDIYGKPTIKDGSYQTLTTAKTPFLFAGREYDGETGLYHYRARAYSPDLGRFLQSDPIDFEGGDSNLYRYCGNNPVNWRDPSGLGWWSDFMDWLRSVAGYVVPGGEISAAAEGAPDAAHAVALVAARRALEACLRRQAADPCVDCSKEEEELLRLQNWSPGSSNPANTSTNSNASSKGKTK